MADALAMLASRSAMARGSSFAAASPQDDEVSQFPDETRVIFVLAALPTHTYPKRETEREREMWTVVPAMYHCSSVMRCM
jgi:hypothetical protein